MQVFVLTSASEFKPCGFDVHAMDTRVLRTMLGKYQPALVGAYLPDSDEPEVAEGLARDCSDEERLAAAQRIASAGEPHMRLVFVL